MGHFILGQNGVRGYDPLAILIPEKNLTLCTCLNYVINIFLFEWILIIHMAYKRFQRYTNFVPLSVWPFICLFVHPSVCPLVNF